MNFVRVIPYWLLSKATNVAAKDFVLNKEVVEYLMHDPYKNKAGELCVIQPVKARRVVELMNMYNAGAPSIATTKAHLAVKSIQRDEKTRDILIHLMGDIEEYKLQEVYLYVS